MRQRQHGRSRDERDRDREQEVVEEGREAAVKPGRCARLGFWVHAGADLNASVLVLLRDALFDDALAAA